MNWWTLALNAIQILAIVVLIWVTVRSVKSTNRLTEEYERTHAEYLALEALLDTLNGGPVADMTGPSKEENNNDSRSMDHLRPARVRGTGRA